MTMRRENLMSLGLRWMLANSAGFTIGWCLFGLIGHGLTGDHGDDLSFAQFMAHTVGLLVAADVISSFQRTVFKRLGATINWSVQASVAILPVAFWAGYYTAGIPFDICLAFATIGITGGLALRRRVEWGRGWVWASSLGFLAGFGITAALTYPVSDALQRSFGGGLMGHVCLFTYIGVVGGTASGLITGLAMVALAQRSKQIISSEPRFGLIPD